MCALQCSANFQHGCWLNGHGICPAALQDTPLYEVLYQEGSALNQRKNERRVRAEAEMLSTCTFAPKLTSQQLVKSGRVMQVRAVQRTSMVLQLLSTGFGACCVQVLQQITMCAICTSH